MGYNKDFGQAGEKIALKYLLQKRYNILENNYRVGSCEIDIIAQKDGVIVFIEVKTRTGLKFGSPAMAVTPHKRKSLLKAVRGYVMEKQLGAAPLRIDVLEILCAGKNFRINHIENAVQGDIYE